MPMPKQPEPVPSAADRAIPPGLRPHFQEYDVDALGLDRDATLILQRTLEYGAWEETRWLFRVYGLRRVREFVRERGERMLSRVTFNYWRKLFGLRRSPFSQVGSLVWPY